jgi:hypothetical protein
MPPDDLADDDLVSVGVSEPVRIEEQHTGSTVKAAA